MKKTYTPLIVGGLVIGGLYLWRKAKAERDPYRAMFAAAAKAPTVIEPSKVFVVSMTDGSTDEMTSAELQRAIDEKRGVRSYVDKEQL
jgi:hypothetical protein